MFAIPQRPSLPDNLTAMLEGWFTMGQDEVHAVRSRLYFTPERTFHTKFSDDVSIQISLHFKVRCEQFKNLQRLHFS